MDTIIKVGVIGVGYLGRFHAQKYAAMEGVELIGVADTDGGRAALVADECGTRPFTDYRALLPLVDAVSIVVPTTLHHQVGKVCLQAGIDVMMEKPITTTVAEADDLIRIARAGERILQVGHLERFNPAVMAMQPLLTHPLFIEAHRIAVFKERGTDVDVVLDLMIHDIDIVLSIVQAPIVSILTAGAPVVTRFTDIANARLIFANGCTANITVSRISLDNMRRMRIFQPGQYLSVDFGKKEIMTVRLKPGTKGSPPAPEISKVNFAEQDALEMELHSFVQHVRDRTQPTVSGEAGRRALDIALQVVSQIRMNREQVEQILMEEGRGDLLNFLQPSH
ncbi:Gfo/Idh/MocA family protein [Desulfobulbus oligotrophicus]|jgi:predicted dehydrogenase|uniref:Gfo/Idh/MocA family oxidoreductase n=1 Tax=Desulfobulbus oligotrophicus TaxID=1909699 RepID=A0A7T6AR37_9BACT|nr:Gfo/Idh/MocA family oxidoreductase [Desulfobulbus oligotrophicus]MDY0390608.1 Gfo/Idh/MocA family oxidoreductase [Desulfobulbus oligotrophicus]QQG66458.1 Gfo/Idh/MocA family oxidoreductase [Desulfobulbus oligotrophicus]